MRKVRDHCHYTGKYRGALHSKCNLRLKTTRTIPVFFHNLTGYDCHLFVKRLADSPGDVSCIPRNEEKYVTFNKRVLVETIVKGEKEVNVYSCLRFVDMMNFMRTSLEKLVGNLERPSFEHTGKYFRGEELDLILKKGIYSYEYMTGVERLRKKLTAQGGVRVPVRFRRDIRLGGDDHTLAHIRRGLSTRAKGFRSLRL